MPGVDVTLTYALPVCAEALATQMKAHIEAIPTVNVLRLCNRFGHGRFSDFPVELVQTIEEYFVEQVHGRVTEELAVASRCFKNKCSILDHADRSKLLKMYAACARSSCQCCSRDYLDDPNDEQLVEALEERHDDYFVRQELEYYEEEQAHQMSGSNWPELIEEIFSKKQSSSVPETLWPECLVLFRSIERRRKWSANLREEMDGDILHEYPSTHGENGFGMAVKISRRPSAEELSRFPQALRVLKLKVFIHSSQKPYPALDLGPQYDHKKLGASNGSEPAGGSEKSKSSVKSAGADDSKSTATPVKKDKASVSPFPCLMLLTRNRN